MSFGIRVLSHCLPRAWEFWIMHSAPLRTGAFTFHLLQCPIVPLKLPYNTARAMHGNTPKMKELVHSLAVAIKRTIHNAIKGLTGLSLDLEVVDDNDRPPC